MTKPVTFNLTHPEEKTVAAETLRSWFRNAKDSQLIDRRFHHVRKTIEMARALEEAGQLKLKKEEAPAPSSQGQEAPADGS